MSAEPSQRPGDDDKAQDHEDDALEHVHVDKATRTPKPKKATSRRQKKTWQHVLHAKKKKKQQALAQGAGSSASGHVQEQLGPNSQEPGYAVRTLPLHNRKSLSMTGELEIYAPQASVMATAPMAARRLDPAALVGSGDSGGMSLSPGVRGLDKEREERRARMVHRKLQQHVQQGATLPTPVSPLSGRDSASASEGEAEDGVGCGGKLRRKKSGRKKKKRKSSKKKRKSSKSKSKRQSEITRVLAVSRTMHLSPKGDRKNLPIAMQRMLEQRFGLPIPLSESQPVPGYASEIPTVLVELHDHLHSMSGMEKLGIFRIAPDAAANEDAKAKVNIHNMAGLQDPHIVANLIKIWFRDLPVPLLRRLDADRMLACTQPEEAWQVLMDGLQEPQLSVALWLLDLGVEVVQHEELNCMCSAAVSVVLAPNVFPPPKHPGPGTPPEEMMRIMRLSKQYPEFFDLLLRYRMAHPRVVAEDGDGEEEEDDDEVV